MISIEHVIKRDNEILPEFGPKLRFIIFFVKEGNKIYKYQSKGKIYENICLNTVSSVSGDSCWKKEEFDELFKNFLDDFAFIINEARDKDECFLPSKEVFASLLDIFLDICSSSEIFYLQSKKKEYVDMVSEPKDRILLEQFFCQINKKNQRIL